MRKDVKFGLTIGGILVVTLVIYVIVLSRGPAGPQRIGIALPNPNSSGQADQATPSHTDTAKPETDDQTDPTSSTSNPNSSSTDSASSPQSEQGMTSTPQTPAPATPSPIASAPATQPAPTATASNDWDSALTHGLPPALSAPQRTETPTIDSTATADAGPASPRPNVARPPTVPLIDPLPTTQPTQSLTASAPPTIDSTPAPLYASAAPPAQPDNAPQANAPRTIEPSPDAVNSAPRTHRVAPGESLYAISQAVYGSGKYYKQILAANPRVDPHHLRIGQILIIPQLNATDRVRPSVVGTASQSASIDPNSQYVVTSGDTLETISRKLYGTPAMIEKIYQMNKSLIGPNENVLKIGWVLKLPEAPTSSGTGGEVRGN